MMLYVCECGKRWADKDLIMIGDGRVFCPGCGEEIVQRKVRVK
jgi:uncharacterized Zn finger protein (UPF0148 family)